MHLEIPGGGRSAGRTGAFGRGFGSLRVGGGVGVRSEGGDGERGESGACWAGQVGTPMQALFLSE